MNQKVMPFLLRFDADHPPREVLDDALYQINPSPVPYLKELSLIKRSEKQSFGPRPHAASRVGDVSKLALPRTLHGSRSALAVNKRC